MWELQVIGVPSVFDRKFDFIVTEKTRGKGGRRYEVLSRNDINLDMLI